MRSADPPTAGWLKIVGLGPGEPGLLVADAVQALAEATDVVGYTTYVAMVPQRDGQHRHVSDNREELDRAAHALDLAAAGGRVAVVSSGDPGVFAMAAAVYEVLDERGGSGRWDAVEVTVVPGVTAALAVAARAGAPLGHDWCCLSLSDNLKPWPVIEQRLQAIGAADLVVALYNPVSRHRPWQLERAFDVLRGHRPETTPVVLGRDVGRPGESVTVTDLATVDLSVADMRTVIVVGSSTTRTIVSRRAVYTPRSYPAAVPLRP